MKEKKERKEKGQPKAGGKVTIKADKIVAAYRILNTPNNPREKKRGFNISTMETEDMYIVLRANDALRPVAERHAAFEKDTYEKLKPADYDELAEKYGRIKELPEAEREGVLAALNEHLRRVDECVMTELGKDREVDAYERLSEEAFGRLVQANGHLLSDMPTVTLFKEILA